MPSALGEAWEQGRLNDGDRWVLVAFGGGLAWASMVLEWVPVGPVSVVPEALHATSGS